ncbi:MAG TPA: Hint domain-containing protein [Candidatus Binatia bacterium]|jgi:hypothetical protein|nr:Hint domain-containing protein [Candidatus Binatia bacterium]
MPYDSHRAPNCLAFDTMIETPAGDVPVTGVKEGDMVMTVDEKGDRVAKPVQALGSAIAPPDHVVIRLVLSDGRQLRISPGHATSDGRTIADLAIGSPYSGATVASVEREKYGNAKTYDLRPEGATGHYWANKVLVGSTLMETPPQVMEGRPAEPPPEG